MAAYEMADVHDVAICSGVNRQALRPAFLAARLVSPVDVNRIDSKSP